MGEDRGLFLSVLDELARPGQVVRNAIAGRPESALRQLGQLGANALDAFLPGDWLPNDIARPEDYISGRELLGAPDDLTGHALGFGADVLTDPLTYLPGGVAKKALGKAGELAGAGLSAVDKVLPGTEDAVASLGRKTRDLFGQQRADHPELWNALDRIRGSSAVEGSAGIAATKKALGALDQRQRTIIGDAIDNVRFGPDGKPVGELIPSGVDPTTGMAFGGIKDRIAAHPDVLPGEADSLADAANQLLEISRNQKARPGIFDPESQANLPDEYLARHYEGLKQDPLEAMMGESGPGLANALKERKNKDWRDILETLNANPGSTYERDALARMAGRSAQQADLAKKADTGAAVFDLLRQGKLSLPDDVLVEEASKLRGVAKNPPVPDVGEQADVGAMIGGKPAEAVRGPYDIGDFSGTSVVPESRPVVTDQLDEVLSKYGMSHGSGTSIAPTTGEVAETIVPRTQYGLPGESPSGTSAVGRSSFDNDGMWFAEVGQKLGLADDVVRKIRALGYPPEVFAKMTADEAASLAERAVKYKAPPIPKSGASADVGSMLGGGTVEKSIDDAYGLGPMSGRAKPPTTGPIEETSASERVLNEMGVGPQSGKSVVPKSERVAETTPTERSMSQYGSGMQSGKSVVGESAKQPRLTKADFKPEEIEAAQKSILGKDFALSDPESKNIVKKTLGLLAESGSPETAKMALDAIQGMAPRGSLMKLLASGNQWFKRFATYGLGLPKAGNLVRNRLNGIFQTFSNPATRDQALAMAKTLPADLSGAVADALGANLGKDVASGTLEEWEHALANSAGDPKKALALFGATHPEEAAFIGHGGVDGYIRAEDLVNDVARSPRMKKIQSFLDLPGKVARGIEDRMRLQLGKAQIQKYMADGMSLDDAAKAAVKDTGDALYRYSSNSAANRTLRDLIPYAAWSTNAIPAEAKFLAEKPYVASAVANAMAKDPNGDPLYPYMEDRVNLDLGKDSTGNRQVANGFGFPFETLSEIPNPSASVGDFGREIEKNVLGQAAPPIKALYGLVAGKDPAFETPFNSYEKIPTIGDAGEAGRIYNMLNSTGLLAPIDAPLRVVDKVLDDRRSLPIRLLDSLTGANVVTVDPIRAQAQQLQQELERNPDVANIAHLTSKDPDAEALIKDLQSVQNRARHAKSHKPRS